MLDLLDFAYGLFIIETKRGEYTLSFLGDKLQIKQPLKQYV